VSDDIWNGKKLKGYDSDKMTYEELVQAFGKPLADQFAKTRKMMEKVMRVVDVDVEKKTITLGDDE
jgi:hypothetical protein